jgi:hypothetical protein
MIPLQEAGALILPPMSVPTPKATHLLATSPASPPELPEQVLVLSNGFFAKPKMLLIVCPK